MTRNAGREERCVCMLCMCVRGVRGVRERTASVTRLFRMETIGNAATICRTHTYERQGNGCTITPREEAVVWDLPEHNKLFSLPRSLRQITSVRKIGVVELIIIFIFSSDSEMTS